MVKQESYQSASSSFTQDTGVYSALSLKPLPILLLHTLLHSCDSQFKSASSLSVIAKGYGRTGTRRKQSDAFSYITQVQASLFFPLSLLLYNLNLSS